MEKLLTEVRVNASIIVLCETDEEIAEAIRARTEQEAIDEADYQLYLRGQ